MNFRIYGIIIIFALFLIIIIINPKLSCFGRRIRAPFYPLLRKKNLKQRKEMKTDDYGFHLSDGKDVRPAKPARMESPDISSIKTRKVKTHDYGFKLSAGEDNPQDQDSETDS